MTASTIYAVAACIAIAFAAALACAAADAVRQRRSAAERAEQTAAKAAERAEAARREAEAKQAEKARAEAERAEAAEEKHRDALRRREELHAQKLQHIAEERAARAKAKPEPALTPDEFAARFAPAQSAADPAPAAEAPAVEVGRSFAPQPFAGHIVAFTGKIKGMTHAEAIRAVEANGGKGYDKMPAGTTLLVVGDNPGYGKKGKMTLADRWIGQTRKITPAQFFDMLASTQP